jgi:chromosomal replication initiation ATPase DnaA
VVETETFIQRVLEDGNNEPIKSRLTNSLGRVPTLADIVEKVAIQAGVDINTVLQSRRGRGSRNVPRWIAITLARDLCGLPLAEIASYFDMAHISGISKTVDKLSEYERHDKKVAQILKVLYQDLTP